MNKLVKLQINTAGAWRDVVRFDASGDAVSHSIMHHAAALVTFADPKSSLRIATADSLQSVLLYWRFEKGWYEPDQRAKP